VNLTMPSRSLSRTILPSSRHLTLLEHGSAQIRSRESTHQLEALETQSLPGLHRGLIGPSLHPK
jgi:phosphoribosyl-dephospho-CoA transferase